VAQVYGITRTNLNGLVLLIERAPHGDFKSYYEKLRKLTKEEDKWW